MKEAILEEAPCYKINEQGDIFNIKTGRKIKIKKSHIGLQNNGVQIRVGIRRCLEKYFNIKNHSDSDGEIWEDIVGFEDLYKVSNHGRIKKCQTVHGKRIYIERILSTPKKINRYHGVLLTKNGVHTTTLIHRIVAMAFIPNTSNKPQVNHINGIKHDNRVDNLEWATSSENIKHSFDTGLRIGTCTGKFGKNHGASKPVKRITMDGEIIATYENQREASEKTGICLTAITACCLGINIKNKDGNTWRFINDPLNIPRTRKYIKNK